MFHSTELQLNERQNAVPCQRTRQTQAFCPMSLLPKMVLIGLLATEAPGTPPPPDAKSLAHVSILSSSASRDVQYNEIEGPPAQSAMQTQEYRSGQQV